MIDLDRAGLDRLLPSTPGSADWGDVLSRSHIQQGRRRRRLAAIAAAAFVVAVGTAFAFGTVRDFFLDRGFIGLPPQGATPSTPESGELVLFFWGKFAGVPPEEKTRIWAYADGRLIVLRQPAGDLPERANALSSGLLEQHLTRKGVELLRAEMISTGLFTHDLELLKHGSLSDGSWGEIRVRNGDRLVRVKWEDPNVVNPSPQSDTQATGEQVRALERIYALLANPASWLPASAWKDRKRRAYVSSRYAICIEGAPHIDPSSVVPLLPEPAQDLLRGHEFNQSWFNRTCTDLTTEEARGLAEALAAAGLEQLEDLDQHALAYRLEIPGPTRFIQFEPYLPHGDFTCSSCG